MEDADGIIRRALGRHGLGSEIRDLVTLWTSPDPGGEGERGNITISYEANGRRRDTAMVSLPTADDAVSLLNDRDRLGSLLSLGIGGIPAARRPHVPQWIAENEHARRVRRDIGRAGRLADAAAEGRDPGKRDDNDASAPF